MFARFECCLLRVSKIAAAFRGTSDNLKKGKAGQRPAFPFLGRSCIEKVWLLATGLIGKLMLCTSTFFK